MKWISVEDQLPPLGSRVMWSRDGGVLLGSLYMFSDDNGECLGICDVDGNFPRHWMPLPPPPEKE
jgi:hypothetical protein